jgi:quercetin dioxygenase-like cupin family protein
MKTIQTKINHQDARGTIIDLVEQQNINAVTVVSFTKDAIRGNHFHKKTTQWNYVTKGKIRLVTQIDEGTIEEKILLPGELAVTYPMEKHALAGLEDSEIIVFTEGPRGGKEYESDTFRLDKPLL